MNTHDIFPRTFRTMPALLALSSAIILSACSGGQDEGDNAMTDKDIDARTAPYVTVKVAGQPEAAPAPAEAAPAPAAPAAPAAAPAEESTATIDGKSLYAACAACHATGVANAPKLGDAAAWGPRAALGIDALTASAIKGKGPVMQPKGGRPDLSDAQIRAIVEYMVNASK